MTSAGFLTSCLVATLPSTPLGNKYVCSVFSQADIPPAGLRLCLLEALFWTWVVGYWRECCNEVEKNINCLHQLQILWVFPRTAFFLFSGTFEAILTSCDILSASPHTHPHTLHAGPALQQPRWICVWLSFSVGKYSGTCSIFFFLSFTYNTFFLVAPSPRIWCWAILSGKPCQFQN